MLELWLLMDTVLDAILCILIFFLIKEVREKKEVKDKQLKADSSYQMYEEVFRLAEMNIGADEISKKVGIPKGEVNLILGLKKSGIKKTSYNT